MKIEDFIEENRRGLVNIIRTESGINEYIPDDDEIELWILNDEGLYNWALDNDVDI